MCQSILLFNIELCRHQLCYSQLQIIAIYLCWQYLWKLHFNFSDHILLPVSKVCMMGFSWWLILHDWVLILFGYFSNIKHCKMHFWFLREVGFLGWEVSSSIPRHFWLVVLPESLPGLMKQVFNSAAIIHLFILCRWDFHSLICIWCSFGLMAPKLEFLMFWLLLICISLPLN